LRLAPCQRAAPHYWRSSSHTHLASWLLSKLTVPAVAPYHLHQTMGGSSTGSMAPLPATTEAATPSPNLACPSTPAQSYPSHPHQTMGGSSTGLMAPSPATTEATTLLPSLARPSTPAWSYPFHPHRTMGGIPEGLMAPSPATKEVATPSPSLVCPSLPTWSSPTHPLPTMGRSAALVACRALERSHQRLASTMSKCPGFAYSNPWVKEIINAVALELQCWYQQHSIGQYLAWQT
jgi:hypothetical protein